ncbi:flagellin [Hyphomicrobium nitrativorans NL23]|uniref:Flagellin n=1 Tax=Hyphomicrobium nitrativorans NL23 TaxID=1029756 RepID=V5SCM5_9HYPH|nr:flagellin [Hyphomicrobium nitrativorans]AHB47775.1 flagellin [Hyphomicrobium nitrativorans NL23]
MSSINTNIAAMTALQTLRSTNSELLQTQNRISTGLRVSSASDNAAYWSIATTMRNDRQSISTVSDALGLGSATAEIASKGIETGIKIASEIKDKLLAARTPGVDRAKIQTEITELQESLKAVVGGASFNGQNWLQTSSDDEDARTIVSSFSRGSDGKISIGTISVDLESTRLVDTSTGASAGGILDADIAMATGTGTVTVLDLDISALEDTTEDLADLEAMISGVDAAIEKMTDAASTLGAVKTRIDIQKDFSDSLMAAIDKGVGQLVDADMNEESTRLQALQVRQQLGIQALGIANQSAQSILSLFR